MSRTSNIIDIVNAGIRAETLRSKAIANNVANLETPGYLRKDVRFKELLENAMSPDGEVDLEDLETELFEPQTTPVSSKGNDVNMEIEVGEMVKNTLRHKAYTRFLVKKYQQIDLAISVK